MASDKLRVGIVLDSVELPAWKHQLIQYLVEAQFATLALVLLDDFERSRSKSSMLNRFLQWFARFDVARTEQVQNACEIDSAKHLLRDVDILRMAELKAAGSGTFQSVVDDRIGQYALDVMIVLGDVQFAELVSRVAKQGAWYFDHDSGASVASDCLSIGFREVLTLQPAIKASLLIYHPLFGERLVAYQTYSPVDHRSLIRSRNWHLWKVASFVTRSLRRLHQEGADTFFRSLIRRPGASITVDIERHQQLVGVSLILPLIRYVVWRLKVWIWNPRRHERWQLMYAFGEAADDFSKFEVLRSPEGTFWADPCAVRHNKEYAIFFEEASTATGHGHLSVLQLSSNGRVDSVTTILSKPYHQSYPFVFEWKGQVFLVPESAENRTVGLYRFTHFPDNVEFVHNLMEDVAAYDATLVEYSGRWWMFANIKAHEGASDRDELCLFYADSPMSQSWQAHPMNPIVSDVRSARPAGRLFIDNGDLYRPSQNSSFRYGYGLNISRVVEMTTTRYIEEIVRRIEPNWSRKVAGLHTWSQCDDLTIIDAICRIPLRNGTRGRSVRSVKRG